jgi:hypothetical protein
MATKEYFNDLMKAENFTNIKSVKTLEIRLNCKYGKRFATDFLLSQVHNMCAIFLS